MAQINLDPKAANKQIRENLYAVLKIILSAKLKDVKTGKCPIPLTQNSVNTWRSTKLIERIQVFVKANSLLTLPEDIHQMVCWASARAETGKNSSFWNKWKRAWNL
jgi:hypothetical protein